MISIRDIIRSWNRFFFEPESPLPIAVYRILFGVAVLVNHALLLPEIDDWFTERGILSFETARRMIGGAGYSLFEWLPHSDAWVWIIFLLSCLSAFTLTIGLFSRASSILLFATLVTLHHRNP